MAGKTIKGITVTIGGDTTELNKALQDSNKKSNSLQKELNQVNKALKLDPKNTVLLAQKQKILTDEISSTKDKLHTLQLAKEQSDDKMKAGTEVNEEAYRQLQREIILTEEKIKSLEKETKKLSNSSKQIAQMGSDMKETGDKISAAGQKGMAVTKIITGAATAAVAAAEGTREYREDMNRLEAAFTSSNKKAESARDIYKEFYAILGESDRSVEAVNHLAKLCNTEEELAMWSDICAGVSATFGDSLPIEGLTEASNETAKTAKVTGVLADALNWIGMSEDEFNDSLSKCSNEQERSTLITNTLSKAYNGAAKEFKSLNADVIESRKSTQEWTDTTAQLGETIEPCITDIKNMILEFASGIVGMFSTLTDSQRNTVLAIGGVAAVIPPLIIMLGSLTTSIGELFTLIAAHPTGAAITALGLFCAGLATAIILANDTSSELSELTDKVNENTEAWNRAKTATEEQTKANVAEIDYTSRLADELRGLADENGKVEEANRNRANFILGELNQAYGTEYTMVDGVIQRYDTLSQSIDTLIAKKRAEIILAGQEEQYKQAITEIDQRRIDNAELEFQIEEQKARLRKNTGIDYEDLLQKRVAYDEAVARGGAVAIEAIQEAEAAQQENTRVLNEQLQIRETYEKNYAAFMSGNADTIAQINTGISESYIKTGNETEQELRERVAITGKVYADMLSEVEKGNSNIRQSEVDAAAEAYNQACVDYERIGGAIPEGMKLGIENSKPSLQTSISNFITLLKGLFTGKDGFDTHSPSKWSESIGGWIAEGLWNGMNGKAGWLKTQVSNFINNTKAWFTGKKGFDTHSPSKWSEGIGEYISEGLALGISSNAYLADNAIETLFNELTETELRYFKEKRAMELAEIDKEYSARLQNAKTAEEAEEIKQEALLKVQETGKKEYLERLKEEAATEREIIENSKKEIANLYKEMAGNAIDSINELEEAQEKLASKMQNYGDLFKKQTTTFKNAGKDGEDLVFEEYKLADLSEQTKELQLYKENLLAIKERGIDVPQSFFEMLRDMSIEDGNNFAGALLATSDAEFAEYIQSWNDKQKTAEEVAKELYADEAKILTNEIKNELEVLPEDFVAYGGYSAISFGDGFMEQLELVMKEVRGRILNEMKNLFPDTDLSITSGGFSNLRNASSTGLVRIYNGSPLGKTTSQSTKEQKNTTVNNYNYGVTPQTAYEVSENTRRTLNALSMQGVL